MAMTHEEHEDGEDELHVEEAPDDGVRPVARAQPEEVEVVDVRSDERHAWKHSDDNRQNGGC